MLITKPHYYDAFRCLAGSCPDSCCKEWTVQVDDRSAKFYRSLPGELGDRLRDVLTTEDGETVMTIEDGRCPMWREDGLCRIQAELGEAALCDVCRNFPRLTHDFGDFVEQQLELSCPAAAELILLSEPGPRTVLEVPGGEEPEYDPADMNWMLELRRELLDILSDPSLTAAQALTRAYLACIEGTVPIRKGGDLQSVMDIYASLEILTPQWPQRLAQAEIRPLPPECKALARYLVERYWLRCSDDNLTDILGKITFVLVSCVTVTALGGDFVQTAQLYSKEIENSSDNVEELLLCAYTEGAFAPENILALVNS